MYGKPLSQHSKSFDFDEHSSREEIRAFVVEIISVIRLVV
jgi:hypothetical protein